MFFNDDEKPFVGFIVGPYWQNVTSDLRCFYVLKQKPYEININIIPEDSIKESTFKQLEEIFDESLVAID